LRWTMEGKKKMKTSKGGGKKSQGCLNSRRGTEKKETADWGDRVNLSVSN